MTGKEKIKELLEATSDGTITAEQVTAAGCTAVSCRSLWETESFIVSDAAYMCSRVLWEMIFTCCSANMDVGYIRMILHYIYWGILTLIQRSIP